ncbi:F184B protein, partial [Bombycilla garrulus]|nr:F184B protein [Bombycilla garrulus]
MASGINNIHQPGTCSGSKAARSTSAEECSREMHMKMCKKIAQLTKVIYALNTKNDEHEDSIKALREAHEEEIQNILAETRETILRCKSKVEEEQLLRKHIQALEIAVAQHKRLKEEALAELLLCKKQAEEKESRTEMKRAQTGLSADTVESNAGFENKLLHLNQEFDGLLNECKTLRVENLDKKVNLDEKCRNVERHTVINEMENLKSENQRTEEYIQKTRELQAPCETEKETLKIGMQQSVIETNCQQRETEQKNSSETEEGFLLQQVKKLEADLEEKSQKINERKRHSQKLKERIQVKNVKRTASRHCCYQNSGFKKILKKEEEDLSVVKERNSHQEKEILHKAGRLSLLRSSWNYLFLNVEDNYSEKLCRNDSRNKLSKTWNVCILRVSSVQYHPLSNCSALNLFYTFSSHKLLLSYHSGKLDLASELASRLLYFFTGLRLSLREPLWLEELQTQLDEFKRKSEYELKQLEKEKEVLTGKLQNSSLELMSLSLFSLEKRRLRGDLIAVQNFLMRESGGADTDFFSPVTSDKTQGDALKLCQGRNSIWQLFFTSLIRQISLYVFHWMTQWKKLRNDWMNSELGLRQVAQLKQTLEQQANNFKESLKKHNLQSNKEKEKLLQDLQNTIKENQNVKLQLEASHQKVLKMLEKSKNQELKEAEERLKKEFNETLKIQHQSHRLEIQTLEEKAKKELHDELEQIQKQQTLLLGSLRMELSEQQTSCTNLKKQIEELQMELRSVRTLKKQQARDQFVFHCHVVFSKSNRSSQSQIRSLHDELEKCQSEISELKKENLLLKDTMELLSAELESQKQEAAQLQDRDKQHRRLLVEDLNIKHKKELDILKPDHRKEIENIVSDFSSTQAHLQAEIFSLETALKELEEKSRKWESRPEDTHLINCLQDKLSEREDIIEQLVEGRKCQHSLSANTESYRNRSFSFNPNTACLTPSMKKKKAVEVPSRVVSVPNLASYAKSFLSCDLRSKRSAPQITKSTSLDRSSGCLRVDSPSAQSSDSSAATRTHGNEPPQTKDDKKQDPQHQEWFTKYFSF